jgi:C-lobe and N-lobe beta barrels of Tf-binding protein B
VAAVPPTGTGNFSGLANGFFVDPTGTAFFTTANMTANTNFQTRVITFSTANTQTVNLSTPTGVGTPNSSLNLNGTFSWSPGNNLFSGTLTNTGSTMTGMGTGRFYGPNAEEIGGTYSLSGGGSTMLGSFGGKR